MLRVEKCQLLYRKGGMTMSFIIAGDTHGTLDLEKVTRYFREAEIRGRQFTDKDYLIILGDVGVAGFTAGGEASTRQALREFPVTTLFIDGNHENFDKLYAYPVEKWNGGKIHRIDDKILHLMRGQVFEICGTTFFTMGGAYSIDRAYRSLGIDWFEEELPSEEEWEEGMENLENAGWEVDYVLTHTGPEEIADQMGYGTDPRREEELPFRRYLQKIAEKLDFSAWYFGHFHEDTDVDGLFFCLYDNVVEVE